MSSSRIVCINQLNESFQSIKFEQYFNLGVRSNPLDSIQVGSYQESRHVKVLDGANAPSLNIVEKSNGQLSPENNTLFGTTAHLPTTSLPTEGKVYFDTGILLCKGVNKFGNYT